MTKRYFGTDGIRGRVGVEPMTAASVLKLGWAAGKVLTAHTPKDKRPKVLIGKDTRSSGYMFESALEAGLSSAGVDCLLLGPMPTPGVAYLTRTFRAAAGIVISASHNPYQDNGLKFFDQDGAKLGDDLELEIEALLQQELVTVDSAELGRARRITDAAGRYIEFCKSTFQSRKRLDGLKLVVDAANGAAYDIASRVFSELGADVTSIGDEPNGLNINKERGATSPEYLVAQVLALGADLGVALDGDADRVIMVDHKGEIVDGDELLFIIAKTRHEQGELNGGVVGTLMTNLGVEQQLKSLGVPFLRSAVGDRFVLEALHQQSWQLGGEGSGHIICLDRTSTGDGIVSALQVLACIQHSEQSLHALKSTMQRYPMRMLNVPAIKGVKLDQLPGIDDAVRLAEAELAEQGRVLLRASGTEPVVRVMVEGQCGETVDKVVQQLASAVAEALQQSKS